MKSALSIMYDNIILCHNLANMITSFRHANQNTYQKLSGYCTNELAIGNCSWGNCFLDYKFLRMIQITTCSIKYDRICKNYVS